MDKDKMLQEKFEDSKNERWGCLTVHREIVCIGCRYSHGEPPFADMPKKSNCVVYRNEDGVMKPKEIYFEGKPCEFREPE